MCYNLIIKSNYQSEDAINFNDMVSKKKKLTHILVNCAQLNKKRVTLLTYRSRPS